MSDKQKHADQNGLGNQKCPARKIGELALTLSKLAVNVQSDETRRKVIELGRNLEFIPPISPESNLVYAYRTILEFLDENDALNVANIWEENGWKVREWMSHGF